ncbi:hypothetical protein GN956_G15659 [Arapaima gigas]
MDSLTVFHTHNPRYHLSRVNSDPHLQHTERMEEMKKALLHPPMPEQDSTGTTRSALPPEAAVQQFPLVQVPDPRGPDDQGIPWMMLVQRNWDIQELTDVTRSLPDPNEVGGVRFWREVLDLDEIYQLGGGEWTQVLCR